MVLLFIGALLRHLRNQGCNTEQLMLNIEDIIIKAILSCTQSIVSACRMFVNHHSNCFELFGFDILIDDTLKVKIYKIWKIYFSHLILFISAMADRG